MSAPWIAALSGTLLAFAPLASGCGLEVSAHPPGAQETDGGGTPASPSGTGSATPPPVPSPGSAPPAADASVPVCHKCVDAGLDAARKPPPPPPTPAPAPAGGCPASCIEEPVGVPPCTAPLRTCDCTAGATAGAQCKPAATGGGLFCCP